MSPSSIPPPATEQHHRPSCSKLKSRTPLEDTTRRHHDRRCVIPSPPEWYSKPTGDTEGRLLPSPVLPSPVPRPVVWSTMDGKIPMSTLYKVPMHVGDPAGKGRWEREGGKGQVQWSMQDNQGQMQGGEGIAWDEWVYPDMWR